MGVPESDLILSPGRVMMIGNGFAAENQPVPF